MKKIIYIFIAYMLILTIDACFFYRKQTHECFLCEIKDFDVEFNFKEKDTVYYNNFWFALESSYYWDCTNTICQNFSIINNLQANTADFFTEGQIKSITIFSNNKYDSTHLQNENLNDIFKIYLGDLDLVYDNFIDSIKFPINTYRRLNIYIDKYHEPDSIRLHKFTIVYEEVDGTVITKTLPEIYLSTY